MPRHIPKRLQIHSDVGVYSDENRNRTEQEVRDTFSAMGSPYALTVLLRALPNRSAKRRSRSTTLGQWDVKNVWDTFFGTLNRKFLTRKAIKQGRSFVGRGQFQFGNDDYTHNPHLHFYVDDILLLPRKQFTAALQQAWEHTKTVEPFAWGSLDVRPYAPDAGWGHYAWRKHYFLDVFQGCC